MSRAGLKPHLVTREGVGWRLVMQRCEKGSQEDFHVRFNHDNEHAHMQLTREECSGKCKLPLFAGLPPWLWP